MTAEDPPCRDALCRDVERDRDEYAAEVERLRLQLESIRLGLVLHVYPESYCDDVTGPHGVGGMCVMPAGHHHRDGLGNEWPVVPPGVISIPEDFLTGNDPFRFAAKMKEIRAEHVVAVALRVNTEMTVEQFAKLKALTEDTP